MVAIVVDGRALSLAHSKSIEPTSGAGDTRLGQSATSTTAVRHRRAERAVERATTRQGRHGAGGAAARGRHVTGRRCERAGSSNARGRQTL